MFPDLVKACWVSRAGSWGSWLRGPTLSRSWCPPACCKANAQGILGLMFTYWCMKSSLGVHRQSQLLGSLLQDPGTCRVGVGLLGGGQGQGPGNAGCRVALVLGLGSLGDKTCPKASTSPLLGRAGSWDLWLQSPGSWSLNKAGGQGQCPRCP